MPPPSRADLERIQDSLASLAKRVETEPHQTLVELREVLTETSTWPDLRAAAWTCQIAAQAARFSDDIDTAIVIAEAGVSFAGPNPVLLNHLRLELAIALRIQHRFDDAIDHLESAHSFFEAEDDASSLAHTAIELGVIHRWQGNIAQSHRLLGLAVVAAERSDDSRTVRRALREVATTMRNEGRFHEAIGVLEALVDQEPAGGHALANVLADLAHTQTMLNDLRRAQTNYVRASDIYAIHGDRLGIGNVERSLGNVAAQLSRYPQASQHLQLAVENYQAAGYTRSVANALKELSLVALGQGQPDAAMSHAVRAWRTFVEVRDEIGQSGALRAIAQSAHALDRSSLRDRALSLALSTARSQRSDLGVANTLLQSAYMADAGAERLASAKGAAELYEALDVPAGIAQASSYVIAELDDDAELEHWHRMLSGSLEETSLRLHTEVDRADFGYTAASASQRAISALIGRNTVAARHVASALIESSTGGALASHMARPPKDRISSEIKDLVNEVAHETDSSKRQVGLHRLASELTILPPTADRSSTTHSAGEIRIVIGPPSPDGMPVLWTDPTDASNRLSVLKLSDADAETIDALGQLDGHDLSALGILWDPTKVSSWQGPLADTFFPSDLKEVLAESEPQPVILDLHPSLRHVPFEALLVGAEPLGAIHDVERRFAKHHNPPATAARRPLVGFADERIDTDTEQSTTIKGSVHSHPDELRRAIGPHSVLWVCGHGRAGFGLEANIETTDGDFVLDAADLLAADLQATDVILESCWAGRSFGRPHGEPLSLVASALLAGASSVTSGLFPLPSLPESTGQIVRDLLNGIDRRLDPPAALRQARRRFLDSQRDTIELHSSESVTINWTSPLLWAGLVIQR